MKHSRSSLFLMELILSILFFSLASAVCIQLFAKSHTLSSETINQNNAIVQAQNLAEAWLAAEGSTEEVPMLLDHCVPLEDSAVSLLFDSSWNPLGNSAGSEARFIARLSSSSAPDEDGLFQAEVTIYEVPDRTIYSLSLSHHVSERRGSYGQ